MSKPTFEEFAEQLHEIVLKHFGAYLANHREAADDIAALFHQREVDAEYRRSMIVTFVSDELRARGGLSENIDLPRLARRAVALADAVLDDAGAEPDPAGLEIQIEAAAAQVSKVKARIKDGWGDHPPGAMVELLEARQDTVKILQRFRR